MVNLAELEDNVRRNPLFTYRAPRLLMALGLTFIGGFFALTILHIEFAHLGSNVGFWVTSLTANISMFIGALYMLIAFYKAWQLTKIRP